MESTTATTNPVQQIMQVATGYMKHIIHDWDDARTEVAGLHSSG